MPSQETTGHTEAHEDRPQNGGAVDAVRTQTTHDVHNELGVEATEVPREHFALHDIDVESVDGLPVDAAAVRDSARTRIVTRNRERGGDFSEGEYSRMKYGCGAVASALGQRLADAYILEHLEELRRIDPAQVVVTSSAYKVAPTASNAVMQGFLWRLNEFFLSLGKGPAHPLQISRLTLAQGDYGALTQQEREKRMRENRLYVDAAQVRGMHVIVVDDCSITGAHERNVQELLAPARPASLRFLYLARFVSAEGAQLAQVEDRLNHAAVATPDAVTDLMLRQDFTLNDRVCKYFLSQRIPSDELAEVLAHIIDQGGASRIIQLHRYCLGNGYAIMPQYAERCRIIGQVLQAKGLSRRPPWTPA